MSEAMTMEELSELDDVVVRLRYFHRLAGEARAPIYKATLLEAAETIEFLRKHAGAISRGPSFAEIAKDLPRRSNEPPEAA